jgi:hypothetical protein
MARKFALGFYNNLDVLELLPKNSYLSHVANIDFSTALYCKYVKIDAIRQLLGSGELQMVAFG